MAQVIRLSQFETRDILPIEARGPGTYLQPLLIEGNSLLSSVFVRSLDPSASVTVKYFDTTTGQVGEERFDLAEHDPVATATTTNRTIVTSIHNKPNLEAIVTGGTVEFGVYATVVSTFATDLDAALQKHLSAINFDRDQALPIAVRDESDELWYFLKGDKGCPIVQTVNQGFGGDSTFVDSQSTTTPGISQTLFSFSVPATKTRHLHQLFVTCRIEGSYNLIAGSAIIASGRTGASTPNNRFNFTPSRSFPSGTTIKLDFQSRTGSPAVDVEAYLMATDIDN